MIRRRVEAPEILLSAEELQRLRRRAGLTQTELAERLGTTKGTVNNWEQARCRVPRDKVARVIEIVRQAQAEYDHMRDQVGQLI